MSTSPKTPPCSRNRRSFAGALSAPARRSLLEQLAQGERGVEALAEKTGLTVANCPAAFATDARAALSPARREWQRR